MRNRNERERESHLESRVNRIGDLLCTACRCVGRWLHLSAENKWWQVFSFKVRTVKCNCLKWFSIRVSSLRSGRNCRWGEWIISALSTLNTTTEVRPLSIGCPLLCVYSVCEHLDGLNSEHTFWVWSPYLTTRNFTSLKMSNAQIMIELNSEYFLFILK